MRNSVFLSFIYLLLSVQILACQPVTISIPNDDHFIRNTSTAEYMVVFGDIQYITTGNTIGIFQHSIDWIRKQVIDGLQINCLLHTGDICHNPNSLEHWNSFRIAITDVSFMVPFYSMIGDHDYSWYDGTHIDGRLDTHFNEYVQFPLASQNVLEQFEKGRMENVVVKNSVHGQRLDLLILEFGPRKEVIEWADKYVKTHASERFIVMTHEYLEKGGGLRTEGLKMATRLQNTSFTTPENIWKNLIKCNDNIVCVLCGHVGGIYSLTVDTNDFGHDVSQIQHNIQSPEFRFDNWLMFWEFPSDKDSANVFIFNTKTKKYYNDKETLFKFRYRWGTGSN